MTEADLEALAREYAECQTCYRTTNPAAFQNVLARAFTAGVRAAAPGPDLRAEALDFLVERCKSTEQHLHALAAGRVTPHQRHRIEGKTEGVAVVRGYIQEISASHEASRR